MSDHDLDKLFKATPAAFSMRVRQTLAAMEDRPARRMRLRPLPLAALMLLCITLVYASLQLGQQWFHHKEFDLYRIHYPDKYQAIMAALRQDPPQQTDGPAAALVDLKLKDYAWVKDQGFLSISLLATVRDAGKAELYSLWEIDLDGAHVGSIDPDDPDSRLEHYLKTPKGFGLPQDVMQDASKRLLLLDFGDHARIGDTAQTIDIPTSHIFSTQEGPVMQVTEVDLSALSPEANQAISASTDQDGSLSLHIPFAVVPFQDNAFQEAIPGTLHVTVRIPD